MQFAAVLNEKKKRIRELEKEIAALKRSSGKGNSAGPSKVQYQKACYECTVIIVDEPSFQHIRCKTTQCKAMHGTRA